MATNNRPFKVQFIPFVSTSHSLPLVELAMLFAARGFYVTILTTHYHSLLFQKSIEKANSLGHHINLYKLKFPSEEVGLPEGIETLSSATSDVEMAKVFTAFLMLQTPMEQVIRETKPDFLIADYHYFWASDLASELGIPRLVFQSRPYFAYCAEHSILKYAPHKKAQSHKDLFLLPGLPDEIQMTSLELPDWNRKQDPYSEILIKIEESEKNSYGSVVNSFYELEKDYADQYKNVVGNRAWSIGPLWLYNRDNNPDKNQHSTLMNWLDSKVHNSVLYISFGSLPCFSPTQLLQIALAIETLNHPFIWVLREADSAKDTKWLPERFEEEMRDENKGLILRGWAPQSMILEHPATGGFLTHCGWNSILESITLGVPMATWPISADQFYNEKLVTRVLRIGVEVGVESWTPELMESCSFVEREKIEKALIELMADEEEAVERRKRATEFSEAAKTAVKEGGSSYSNLTALLDELIICPKKLNGGQSD
ncbi:hypothetical protein REPUB_Repub19eG0047900 [Reevesia pubescens]